MSTTAEKLAYLSETKAQIRDAIEAQGVSVPETTPFRGYAEKIGEIRCAADYAENDPDQPGYIANRPCYFTGEILEDTVMDDLSVPVGSSGSYSGEVMEAGEKYRLTIKGVSVELTAFAESLKGVTGTMIGDSYVDFMAAASGGGAFTPTYGYLLGTLSSGGASVVGLIPTDGTGAMLMAAFGLTSEELAAGTVSVTLTHLVPEAVKLSKHLLPDGIGASSPVKVVDIGSGSLSDIDFSVYQPGDIVLVVGNM